MDTFWKWMLLGSRGGPPGIGNLINLFLPFHLIIAWFATTYVRMDPFQFASKALFPAASILIGMSMAWTTRAATVLQSAELRNALFTEDRAAEDYIYGFQLAILVIIIMVVYVSAMAGGGINIGVFSSNTDRCVAAFTLYFLLSLSIRECWGVVNFTNMLSMLEYRRSK
jgi:hypothetical protein